MGYMDPHSLVRIQEGQNDHQKRTYVKSRYFFRAVNIKFLDIKTLGMDPDPASEKSLDPNPFRIAELVPPTSFYAQNLHEYFYGQL